MSESIIVEGKDKKEKYESILPQIKALVKGEPDLIANLSNIASALKYGMNFFWMGFYFVRDNELVLGPFQGTVACTRIAFGKGVCGKAWEQQKPIVVEDVDQFPGHIACSSESRSEIVFPVFDKNGKVFMVMDIDSKELNDFDEVDKVYLQEVVKIIEQFDDLKI